MENYKLKKEQKNLKLYMKLEKTIIKFGDIEIKKKKFHQRKSPILIENININKKVIYNKVIRALNISLATKMLKN